MTLWGADLPVAAVILAGLFFALWAWIASDRHGRVIRRMADWLARERPQAWAALPWTARRLSPRSGIAELKRRGLADDPDFQALEARADRLYRQFSLRLMAGLLCIGLLIAGKAYLGWAV
jgi:hypothetical protein